MDKEKKMLKVKESIGATSSLSRRKFFKKQLMVSLPNLIEGQIDAYQWFLDKGLRELFDEINPISDFTGKDLELSLTDYYLDEAKTDELVAKNKNVSYEA